MDIIHPLIIFDISFITVIYVIASLSSRLGEALKIPQYYKLFYFSITITLIGSVLNIIQLYLPTISVTTVSLVLRLVGGSIAVLVALRYWQWLFTEYFKN